VKSVKKAPAEIALGIDEDSGQVQLTVWHPRSADQTYHRNPCHKAAIEQFLRRRHVDLERLAVPPVESSQRSSSQPRSFVTGNGTDLSFVDASRRLERKRG
jgi:hypothetical protein